MSNYIPNVENSIILSTVKYGAEKGVANISTVAVADAADVSEYTIFKHFKTKQGLLIATAEYCDQIQAKWCLDLASSVNSIEEYWDVLINKLNEFPVEAKFLFNYVSYYGYKNYKSNQEIYQKCARKLFSEKYSDEQCMEYFDYISTLIYLYFLKLTSGYPIPTNRSADTIKNLLFKGLNSI